MTQTSPLPQTTAWRAIARCVARSLVMLARGRVRCPDREVGRRIEFADGSTGIVYRETVVEGPPPADPCVLVVSFRLRAVRGRGHKAFEPLSLLNTPLFAGFPGLVSKLWLAHDGNGLYRGLYEWDGPQRAEHYARSLWRVLALVSVRGSIDFRVLPGLHRDDVLRDPRAMDRYSAPEAHTWWRVTAA